MNLFHLFFSLSFSSPVTLALEKFFYPKFYDEIETIFSSRRKEEEKKNEDEEKERRKKGRKRERERDPIETARSFPLFSTFHRGREEEDWRSFRRRVEKETPRPLA